MGMRCGVVTVWRNDSAPLAMRPYSWKINKFKGYTHRLQLDPTTRISSDWHLQWPGQAWCIWCPVEKKKTRLVCLRVQLEMMTCDLSALKNGAKNRKSPLGGVTESEPVNQKREWWCHRNENKAWWCHQGYKRACHSVFPHSLASSRGGNISRKESMSHGISK